MSKCFNKGLLLERNMQLLRHYSSCKCFTRSKMNELSKSVDETNPCTYIGTTAQSSEVQRLPSFRLPYFACLKFPRPYPFGHLTIAFACFGCDRVVFFM